LRGGGRDARRVAFGKNNFGEIGGIGGTGAGELFGQVGLRRFGSERVPGVELGPGGQSVCIHEGARLQVQQKVNR